MRLFTVLKRILLAVPMFAATSGQAQVEVVRNPMKWLTVKNDKRYIEDHSRKVTVRAFANSKFSRFVIGQNVNGDKLPYSTNDNLSLGAGFNWRFLGLNLGFKMPFVNSDTKRFGRTRSVDIQSFFYFRKLQVDLYAQAYNGMYISDRRTLISPRIDNAFPYREDMRARNFGMNAQYIFNNRRFSYRAAFVQNEYQKKSAGSFILGGAIYHFRAKADSAIIPGDIVYAGTYWKDDYTKTNITSLSISAGYAYTLVVKKNFFATASFTAGPGLNYTSRKDDVADLSSGGLDYALNGTLRLAAGYNSPDYFAGVQYIRLTNKNGVPGAGEWQQFETGSVRLTVTKRFKLSRKMEKKVLKAIEDVKDDVEEIIY
jgi:hypothetical protein